MRTPDLYLFHVGFAFAGEVKKNFSVVRLQHKMFKGLKRRERVSKVRPVVQARLDKLRKYWYRASI